MNISLRLWRESCVPAARAGKIGIVKHGRWYGKVIHTQLPGTRNLLVFAKASESHYSSVGGRGATAPPKGLICKKSVKIYENVRKTPDILGKLLENTDKNGAQRCLVLKNWHPTLGQSHETLFWRLSQKWSVWQEVLARKVARKAFGQVWGNSGKHFWHPQKFASSYTYVTVYLRDDMEAKWTAGLVRSQGKFKDYMRCMQQTLKLLQ